MAQKRIKVFFSRRAENDLLEIYRYVSEQSVQALQIIDKKIFKALRQLEKFPRSGHGVKELSGKRYREILVFHYRMIYRHLEKERRIHILTIRHGKRLLPPSLLP